MDLSLFEYGLEFAKIFNYEIADFRKRGVKNLLLLLLKNFLLSFNIIFTYSIISDNQLINCTCGSISTGRACCIAACMSRDPRPFRELRAGLCCGRLGLPSVRRGGRRVLWLVRCYRSPGEPECRHCPPSFGVVNG
jgi:hypothetical protein